MLEILSPAGKLENVYAAVNNGCNAIYVGGKNFNARGSADNFTCTQLEEVIDYCHLRGVNVYICVNTLYKNSELPEVMDFVKDMYEKGADAFILQDIGTAMFIRSRFPDIKLHASTQMTAHSLEDCMYLQSVGFDRVVLSRECSLEDIKYITANTTVEIEVFVHGALCVCYSGRCLMSSFLGGRSGNRGRCAQPCRLMYSLEDINGYLLSPKDMMTLNILPQIMDAGVKSIKIEGRMKSPEYTAVTAAAYRQHIDRAVSGDSYFADEESVNDLLAVFNRGGDFTEGYFTQTPSKGMISIKTPKSTGVFAGTVLSYDKRKELCEIQTREDLIPGDGIEIWTKKEPHTGTYIAKKSSAGHKITINIQGAIEKGDLVYKSYDKAVIDKAKKLYEKDKRKINVTGNIYAKVGEPICLTLRYKEFEVKAEGEVLQKPQNIGLSSDDLIKRLSKTGDTTFKVDYSDNNIVGDIYASISGLNALRREACEKLSKEIIQSYKRRADSYSLEFKEPVKSEQKYLTVLVKNEEQFKAATVKGLKRIYVEQDVLIKDAGFFVEEAHRNNIELFVALKHINHRIPNDTYENFEKSEVDGYLIRTYGQFYNLRDSKKLKVLDYGFNIMNSLSNKAIDADFVALSTELELDSITELGEINNEITVYGYIPLMITRQCPAGAYLQACGKDKVSYLKDRTGAEFPVVADCESCYAVIYNSRPIFMLHKLRDILQSTPAYMRMEFTIENYNDTREMVLGYLDMVTENDDWAVKMLLDKLNKNFTNGHYYRGV